MDPTQLIFKRFMSTDLTKNIKLINDLIKLKKVKSIEVEKVMKSIDRQDFVNEKYVNPYQAQYPDTIGFGATISAPVMHAHALEILKPILLAKSKVLDVGSGSGYLTLAFAKMMDHNKGIAYGVEHIKELIDQSILNIKKNHSKYIEKGRVVIVEGDGRQGLEKYAPYDAIHVGAAAEEIPEQLIKQLALGGRLVMPVGKQGIQDYTVVDKDELGKITKKIMLQVDYIPLTSKNFQLGKW